MNTTRYSSTLCWIIGILQLVTWSYAVHTGPLLRELIKPGPNKLQGVFLTQYGPEYAVVLNLHNNVSRGDERKDVVEEGEFFVQAPNNYGVVVVIQYLQLRTQLRGLNEDSLYKVCRDYVQFRDDRGNEGPQICGELMVTDRSKAPEKLLGKRTFFAPFGVVNVKLHIDKSESKEYSYQLWNTVRISFTAVSECDGDKDLPKEPKSRPCLNNRTLDNNAPAHCIAPSLFCDFIYNCGVDEDYIGSDELNCTDPETLKVPLGAGDDSGASVTMILFFVFGILIVVVFVAVYFITELNGSLRCFSGSRLHNSSSNVQVNKESDQISSPNDTPPMYSNFSIEEPNRR